MQVAGQYGRCMSESPRETDVNFSWFSLSAINDAGVSVIPVITVNLEQYPTVVEPNGDTRSLVHSDLLASGFMPVTHTDLAEAVMGCRERAVPKTKCWLNLSPTEAIVHVRIGSHETTLATLPIGAGDVIDREFRKAAAGGCVLLVGTGFAYGTDWVIQNFDDAVLAGDVIGGLIPVRKLF